jgi:heme-degrading monooxygenase HmoA
MPTVILINPFEIAAGEEEQFLKIWLSAAGHMRHAPGFRSLRLHKSLDSQAKFRFVNVAEWESEQQWQEAVRTQPAESSKLLPCARSRAPLVGSIRDAASTNCRYSQPATCPLREPQDDGRHVESDGSGSPGVRASSH